MCICCVSITLYADLEVSSPNWVSTLPLSRCCQQWALLPTSPSWPGLSSWRLEEWRTDLTRVGRKKSQDTGRKVDRTRQRDRPSQTDTVWRLVLNPESIVYNGKIQRDCTTDHRYLSLIIWQRLLLKALQYYNKDIIYVIIHCFVILKTPPTII